MVQLGTGGRSVVGRMTRRRCGIQHQRDAIILACGKDARVHRQQGQQKMDIAIGDPVFDRTTSRPAMLRVLLTMLETAAKEMRKPAGPAWTVSNATIMVPH